MPFFSRAEMDNFVALTGKSLGCAGKKSVPTGLKKATTFLKDEFESYSDEIYFLCVVNVTILSKKRCPL